MPKLLWTNRANFGPSARKESTMCYDTERSRTVLFGGNRNPDGRNSPLGDTWEWDGSFWTQVEDTGPSARSQGCMVYDSAQKASVLFGGEDTAALGDTWQWDGIDWTKVSESGPSARSSAAMAFDSARNRSVLFAGQSDNSRLNDTWEFDGQNWTQQQDIGPPARRSHAMAFDNVSKRVVLFGGMGAGDNSLGDTWAWDGGEWVQVAEFGPSPRLDTALSTAGGSNLILFGGTSGSQPNNVAQILGDTWEFDGKRWTQRQDIGPSPLQSAALAFDSGRNRVVLFGEFIGVEGLLANSGLTWETSDLSANASPPVLKLSSISFPPVVHANVQTAATFTLSAPAPAGGAVILVSNSLRKPDASELFSVTVPFGLLTITVPVAFFDLGSILVTAGLLQPDEIELTVFVE
jgi:hypothetical protein